MGGLLKNKSFSIDILKLAGFNCQFITLKKGIEVELPVGVSGVVSFAYSPFVLNKVVKIIPTLETTESIIDSWWGNELNIRVSDGIIYLTQTLWDDIELRVISL